MGSASVSSGASESTSEGFSNTCLMLATAAQTSSSVGGAPNTTPCSSVASPRKPAIPGLAPAATTSSQSSSPSRRSERDSQDAVQPLIEDGGGGDVARSGRPPPARESERPPAPEGMAGLTARLARRTRFLLIADDPSPALPPRRSLLVWTTYTTIETRRRPRLVSSETVVFV